MAQQTIRVGIIGAGENTRTRHIPGLRAIEGVEIVGVCNRSRGSTEQVARDCGIPRIYDHWRQAIDDSQTGAVLIGTWPYLHCRATIAALEAGKHVLTEARMARDAREARRMLEAAEARPDLVAQIVPSPMTLEVDRTIRRLLAERYLGQVLAIEHHEASADFLDREAPLHWRGDFDLSGLNVMALGIYYEAIMRWVGEATAVAAMGRTFVPMRPGADGRMRAVRVPEHLDVVAQMACGAQLHIQQSAVSALLEGGGTYLFGSDGTLRVRGGRLYGGRRGDRALGPIEIPAHEKQGWRVEAEFVGAIRGLEAITHTRFEDGVKYMEFTEAARRSMATGRTVALPLALDG
jgi:predicted dehydrogenase